MAGRRALFGAILCTTTSLGLFVTSRYMGTSKVRMSRRAFAEGSVHDGGNLRATNVPRLPVLLLSGVLGGAVKKVGLGPVEYFRGIPEAMKDAGAIVFDPYTPPTSSIEKRAKLVGKLSRKFWPRPARNKSIWSPTPWVDWTVGTTSVRWAERPKWPRW